MARTQWLRREQVRAVRPALSTYVLTNGSSLQAMVPRSGFTGRNGEVRAVSLVVLAPPGRARGRVASPVLPLAVPVTQVTQVVLVTLVMLVTRGAPVPQPGAAPPPRPPPPSLPVPTPIAREVRPEHGRTPGYFTHNRRHARVGGRLGLGVSGLLGASVPVRAAFALDAVVAGRVPASRRRPLFALFPEVGYSLAAGARHTRGHVFTAGLGLGGTRRGVGAAIIPRFVAGTWIGERALGVRTGLLVEKVQKGGVGLELSHQALQVAGEWSHALVASLFIGLYWPRER